MNRGRRWVTHNETTRQAVLAPGDERRLILALRQWVAVCGRHGAREAFRVLSSPSWVRISTPDGAVSTVGYLVPQEAGAWVKLEEAAELALELGGVPRELHRYFQVNLR